MCKGILKNTDYFPNEMYKSSHPECKEGVAMLVNSIKTSKSKP